MLTDWERLKISACYGISILSIAEIKTKLLTEAKETSQPKLRGEKTALQWGFHFIIPERTCFMGVVLRSGG